MKSRLDRFISKTTNIHLREVQRLLARGDITLDNEIATSLNQTVNQFSRIVVRGQALPFTNPVYLMLNKPKEVVCATKDARHTTVLDLIDHPQKNGLHIVGRLDLNSTGLVLLTNDGRWSRSISSPETKLPKVYRVTLANPLEKHYIEVFTQGLFFKFENITTLPAQLTILSEHIAEVVLFEGKYHQIKRMFGHFNNPVIELLRTAVGSVVLDSGMEAGAYRELTAEELTTFRFTSR